MSETVDWHAASERILRGICEDREAEIERLTAELAGGQAVIAAAREYVRAFAFWDIQIALGKLMSAVEALDADPRPARRGE